MLGKKPDGHPQSGCAGKSGKWPGLVSRLRTRVSLKRGDRGGFDSGMTTVDWDIGNWSVRLVDDTTWTSQSVDNLRRYEHEYNLDTDSRYLSSSHGVIVSSGERRLATAILLGDGGATGVHNKSLAHTASTCFIAVGAFIAALRLPSLELAWHTKVDTATCFGVYYHLATQSLLVHGELEISRLDLDGRKLWSYSGRDIFTGEFRLTEREVRVVDFCDDHYSIDINTGKGTR